MPMIRGTYNVRGWRDSLEREHSRQDAVLSLLGPTDWGNLS